jgi:hypothetical protein
MQKVPTTEVVAKDTERWKMKSKCCGADFKSHLSDGECGYVADFFCLKCGKPCEVQPCVEPEPQKHECSCGDMFDTENELTQHKQMCHVTIADCEPPEPQGIVLTTDLTCNCGEQMRKDESSANAQLPAIIARAKRELAREFIPLVEKLFEALSHADFSNGNEEYGVDEGREMARVFIKDLSDQFEALKSKYCEEK